MDIFFISEDIFKKLGINYCLKQCYNIRENFQLGPLQHIAAIQTNRTCEEHFYICEGYFIGATRVNVFFLFLCLNIHTYICGALHIVIINCKQLLKKLYAKLLSRNVKINKSTTIT